MIDASDQHQKNNRLLDLCSKMLESRRLIVVSNRGPVEYHVSTEGDLSTRRGTGGVVTALNSLVTNVDFTWISSAMGEGDRRIARENTGGRIRSPIPGHTFSLKFVVTSRRVYHKFYNIFCNPLLWFLHHYMWSSPYTPNVDSAVYDAWENGYVPVNRSFADSIIEEAQNAHDSPYVMIHDYHLYMVAGMVREALPNAIIQHMIHIPWPDPSYMQMLPAFMRTKICQSLLMNNIVGFQTWRDVRNFLQSCEMFVPGIEVDHNNFTCILGGHKTKVKAYPVGISVQEVRSISESNRSVEYGKRLTHLFNGKTIVRIDRVEPSKNIIRGFRAYRLLLERNPDLIGSVTFLAFLVPSRTHIRQYQRYLQETEDLISEINQAFGNDDWKPIVPFYDNNYTQAMVAMKFYNVLLVNPIIDGMNLVVKEGPVVNTRSGVLVLSETAGAYPQIKDGVISISPADIEGTALALYQALTISAEKRLEFEKILLENISQEDIVDWIEKQVVDLTTEGS